LRASGAGWGRIGLLGRLVQDPRTLTQLSREVQHLNSAEMPMKIRNQLRSPLLRRRTQ
jgi:hypothetical protein